MGDDTCSRPQLLQDARAQLDIDGRSEIKRQDRRLADIRLEQVLLTKLHFVGDTGLIRVLACLDNAARVDINPKPTRSEALGRRDRNAAVPAAKVAQIVICPRGGEL